MLVGQIGNLPYSITPKNLAILAKILKSLTQSRKARKEKNK